MTKTNDDPDSGTLPEKPADQALTRRDFIGKTVTSAVKITVAGVAGAGLLTGQASASDPRTPSLRGIDRSIAPRTPQINPSIQRAPEISPSVQRVFDLGVRDPAFRRDLMANPEAALQKHNIRMSPNDARTLKRIIDEGQRPGGSDRFGCPWDMTCGYKGA